MFSYCLNNPVSMVDDGGDDAVVLYDERYYGHNGMLVQDEGGNWWHYYWGAAPGKPRKMAEYLLPVPSISFCELYEGEITLEAINEGVSYKGYTDLIYLDGNFSKSAETAKKQQDGIYNTIFNNCSQKTFSILSESETDYQYALWLASLHISPKMAFKSLKGSVSEGLKINMERC